MASWYTPRERELVDGWHDLLHELRCRTADPVRQVVVNNPLEFKVVSPSFRIYKIQDMYVLGSPVDDTLAIVEEANRRRRPVALAVVKHKKDDYVLAAVVVKENDARGQEK